jgi:hypothetical protein
MNRNGWIAATVASVLLLGASSGQAASVSSGSAGAAKLCTNAACTLATLNLSGPSGPVTGSYSINLSTLQLEFDLTLGSALLTGSDGSITSMTLQNVQFEGTATLAIIAGIDTNGTALPNFLSITTGTASAAGSYSLNGGPLVAFTAQNIAVGGGCQQNSSGRSVCGPIFNPFAVLIGDSTRYLSATLNVAAPEPGSIALLGLGLAALAGIRYRRS